MKPSFIFLSAITLFLVVASCQEPEAEVLEEEIVSESCNNGPKQNFNTSFKVNNLDGDFYGLEITMTPGEGSYYASPYSMSTMMGAFNVDVETGIFLTMENEWSETPQSEEIFDEISKCNVNWVYDETTYNYRFKVNREQDFQVPGIVSFVIEPECNRYEVGFSLKQKDGELSVEKTTIELKNITP